MSSTTPLAVLMAARHEVALDNGQKQNQLYKKGMVIDRERGRVKEKMMSKQVLKLKVTPNTWKLHSQLPPRAWRIFHKACSCILHPSNTRSYPHPFGGQIMLCMFSVKDVFIVWCTKKVDEDSCVWTIGLRRFYFERSVHDVAHVNIPVWYHIKTDRIPARPDVPAATLTLEGSGSFQKYIAAWALTLEF